MCRGGLTTVALRAPAEVLTVPIGIADSGDVLTVGLRRDGPHGLVAGTTASGKSELLQTILLGLAATHPPEHLGFVLIDYKGGAAFADIARLPHALGLVTDLDGRLASRALVSFGSELRRRERILRDADARTIAEYERSGAARDRPLPNLLIVVDELATLVNEVPGFVDALVDVAQRGRSLGLHLLLATQSPGGVVGAKVQANLNFRVCLRVTLASESQAVIGTDVASLIPVNAPGRGYLKVGAAVTGFQAVRVTRPAPTARRAGGIVQVAPFLDDRPAGSRAPVPERPAVASAGLTEARLLVDRLASEARRLGTRTFDCPWAPPLPAVLHRAALAGGPVSDAGGPGAASGDDSGRLTALVGLVDEPELQRRSPWRLDLSSDGGCVALGAFGSGKTTLLRQIALDLATRWGPGDLHLYGFDAGDGSLAPLARLPHCAAVVGVVDLERTMRALGRLARMADERRALLATAGASDWTRLRAGSDAGPWILVLLDDYPAFAEMAEADRQGALAASLATVVRSGPQVGIHPVVTAQRRADVPSSLFGALGRRVLLRQSETAEYDLAGLPRDLQPASVPPGRAWIAGGPPREVQVVLPSVSPEDYPPPELAHLLRRDAASPDRLPRPVPAFPSEVPLDRLLSPPALASRSGRRATPASPLRAGLRRAPARRPDRSQGLPCPPTWKHPTPPGLVIGLGGPELEPVSVDLARTDHLLIAGSERLGRSTALLTCMGAAARDPGTRFVVLAPRTSPLRALAPGGQVLRTAATPSEIVDAVEWVDAADRPVLLVADDCEALPQEVAASLSQVLRRARETGVHGLFAGRLSDLCRSYDDWVRYLRSQRSGVLLAPDPADADLFDLRLPPVLLPRLPGRGYLVRGHELVPLQVAVTRAR